jgi:hypothetical protein
MPSICLCHDFEEKSAECDARLKLEGTVGGEIEMLEIITP